VYTSSDTENRPFESAQAIEALVYINPATDFVQIMQKFMRNKMINI